MEFDEMWHGLTKTVQFQAADMSTPISVTLTADLLEDGSTDTYLVPIPAGAKARHGIMRLAVKGAAVIGDIETNAVLAVYGSFTVKESNWSSDAEEAQDVTPTQAEQLQSEIDVLLDEIAAITGHTEDSEAWAVGEREGVPVGPGDETYDNNAKHYAAAAAEKADAVLDMTVSAEGLPEGSTPEVEKTTSGGVFNLNFKIPHGMRGYRIGSVYKKSGTGAPGTTDVYGMKLNDPGQTEVGTFSVYNGANGEGSGDFMADGSVPMTGNLNANGHNVVGVSTPTANTDAANKKYVDDETEKRYTKPSGGIPKTDLASGVQTSLNAADNAVTYTAQTGKTDAQKQQARENIDAAGRTEVEPLINQWDEQWRLGRWNQTSGNYEPMTDRICSANYIPVKPSTQYYVHAPSGFLMVFYDSNYSRISQATLTGAGAFTTPSNAAYMNFTLGSGYGTTYNHDISINYPATYTGYYPAGLSMALAPWADLLWENASPTAAFAGQTMSVGISGYKFVMLIYRISANDATNFLTELVPVGKKRDIICFSGGTIKMRSVTPNAGNSITFSDARNYTAYGNASSYTVDNSILIPVSIYGIR